MGDAAASIWRSQRLSGRLVRFAVVGGSTSTAYAMIVAGVVGFMSEPAAAALAYLILLPINFYAHRRAVFRSHHSPWPQIGRYLAMHGITLVACTVAMALVTGALGASHWAGSAAIVLLAPILNFSMMHYWVYRQ